MLDKPFLRWAGGKTWLTSRLDPFLPQQFNNYHEPFLGGGSIYFNLISRGLITSAAHLSDLNDELILTYQVIRDNHTELVQRLALYQNESSFYYDIRSRNVVDPIDAAARFIYLNRTSFNGIYRVNKQGYYNVPFGKRSLSKLFDFDQLERASEQLTGSHLVCADFAETLINIQEGDLVFIDPPYTVAHENNGFVKYNQRIFAWEDQVRLVQYIEEINNIGAYFIMTNAAHISIEELYAAVGLITRVQRPSLIGGKGAARVAYNELIFTNIGQ